MADKIYEVKAKITKEKNVGYTCPEKKISTANFGDWQENLVSDRKNKVSSKYGKCLDNIG